LLRRVNTELLSRPLEQEEAVRQMTQQLGELYTSLLEQYERVAEQQSLAMDKDSQIETLERDLSDARAREGQLRRENEVVQGLQTYQALQEQLVERQDEKIDEIQAQLEESRRENLRLQERVQVIVNPGQLRRELEASKLEYDRLYRIRTETESELADIFEEELDEVRQLPVHRLNGRNPPVETGETLGQLLDERRHFYIVETLPPQSSLGLAPNPFQEGHAMTREEDSLRALLLKAARTNQSGRLRVRLTQEDENGVRQFELMADGLPPQRIASFRPLELVLDMEQTSSQRMRYLYTSALPRRIMSARGQLRVQQYNAEQPQGEELVYPYDLQCRGVCVVNFTDGASLYATFISASLYRLDLFVLPINV
jgi:hypothetical protein